MKILLDTHALLWWLSDDKRLGPAARELVANPDNDILVSVVSFWEIVIKIRIGKLKGDVKEIWAAAERDGFRRVDISRADLVHLTYVAAHHGDPFDHMLIAQARAQDAVLMSNDGSFGGYAVQLMRCSAGGAGQAVQTVG